VRVSKPDGPGATPQSTIRLRLHPGQRGRSIADRWGEDTGRYSSIALSREGGSTPESSVIENCRRPAVGHKMTVPACRAVVKIDQIRKLIE
jgi:hypothetical protein